jgi:hypothetical protein
MFQCIYYKIDTKIVDQILKIIRDNKIESCPVITATKNGYQSNNIVKLFNTNILKKIVPINELYKKIFHIHYIRYNKGGYQEEHLHKPDDYSFILYLNNSDGDTVIKHPINKKFTPKKGKIVVFNGKILHYAEPSFKNKKILVGAMK